MLSQIGAAAAGLAFSSPSLVAGGSCRADELIEGPSEPRVAVAREDALARGKLEDHRELLRKLIDASLQKLTDAPDAAEAWGALFKRQDRVGIKVNTLGLSTQPPVVDAIVQGLLRAGVKEQNIIIWDRLDVELDRAGFKLNRSGRGAQCRGTDAERVGKGYKRQIEVSGRIGSCFSVIAADEVDALISVPVLKDHNLAGVSLGMKNFYGAIHNPNKYHDDNCDPYIVDVISHRFIAPKWRLTVCDGTRAQYHNGPGSSPGYRWPFNGLIVSNDFVAADAVAAAFVEAERKKQGLPKLAQENRPTTHIVTAAARGWGEADLGKIRQVEV
jgi:uncharacterized protein (DUF362 family)